MTAAAILPPAPMWNWHDQAVCCICAPHWLILPAADRQFLWRLDGRPERRTPSPAESARLTRIVALLDNWALDAGIAWP